MPGAVRAQADTTLAGSNDSTRVAPAPAPPATSAPKQRRFYYGGGISLGFGSLTRVSASPVVGYRLSKVLSVGTQLSYEYLQQEVEGKKLTTHNYGGSLFGRFHPMKKYYTHVEPALYRQERVTGPNTTTWASVPYIFIGGGVLQPVAPGVTVYVQITYDVLQDPDSPYKGNQSFVTTGIAVGL